MPTHVTQCVVCGGDVACCCDEHGLGVGGKHGEAGCENPPFIEFCSLAHAEELFRRLGESIERFKAMYPDYPTPTSQAYDWKSSTQETPVTSFSPPETTDG